MGRTQKQKEASRKNGLSSTGPKTEKGKAVVSRNAVSHGILSRLTVLPGVERPEDWSEHLEAVSQDLQPTGRVETLLAERVALGLWRLGRVARFERDSAALAIEATSQAIGRESWMSSTASHHDSALGVDLKDQGAGLRKRRDGLERLQKLLKTLPKLAASKRVDSDIAANLIERVSDECEAAIYDDIGKDWPPCPLDHWPDSKGLHEVAWKAGTLRKTLQTIRNAMFSATCRCPKRSSLSSDSSISLCRSIRDCVFYSR